MTKEEVTMVLGSKFALAGALGVFAIAVPLASIQSQNDEARSVAMARWDEAEAREQRNHSSIAVILGEFRANFSDLMFVKTERYLHSGIGYRPHLDTELMQATGDIQDRGSQTAPGDVDQKIASPEMLETAGLRPGEVMIAEAEDQEEFVPTIIRTRENDFRGFLGDLEREIKPWRDPSLPHIHTAGTELLPWFRLATLGNPQNERAYVIGTWWLRTMQTEAQLREGLRFIEEGVANNPTNFNLFLMRGYVLRDLEQNQEARESFLRAAELVFLERPADGQPTRDWTPSREDLAIAAWNMAVLTTRDQKGTVEALQLAEQLQERAHSPALARLVTALQNDIQVLGLSVTTPDPIPRVDSSDDTTSPTESGGN
jgi:hypothetical protein